MWVKKMSNKIFSKGLPRAFGVLKHVVYDACLFCPLADIPSPPAPHSTTSYVRGRHDF